MRGLFTYFVEMLKSKIYLSFMGYGRHMQDSVCGAAQGHINSHGIFECFGSCDITWENVFIKKVQDCHTCLFSQTDTGSGNSRDGAVTR